MSTALVTGANSGIGFETCRMLADESSMKKIILACRSMHKANAAIEQLVHLTGRTPATFDTLLIDTSDLKSVRAAVEAATGPIDTMVLNAGGMGSDAHLELTSDGITRVMAMNTTGHAAFFEGLLEAEKLASDARIIYTGSELARGLIVFAPKPSFASDDIECVMSHIVGKPKCGYRRTPAMMSVMSSYAAAKAVGTLYFQHCARENPSMAIYTVSPGMCHGTNALRGVPKVMKSWNMQLQLRVLSLFGLAQESSVGSRRNIDTLFGRGVTYPSGTFIASKRWATGATCDQGNMHSYLYNNETLQHAAAVAVRKVIS